IRTTADLSALCVGAGAGPARTEEIITAAPTAEAAVKRVKDDRRARLDQVVDPYLRERVLDLEDIGNRLIKHLMGDTAGMAPAEPLPDDVILVARDMGPAELLDYDRKCLRGLVLEEGSATSHVAIVARAIDIPVLGRVNNLF